MTDAPASDRALKTVGKHYECAPTKAEHDAVVAAKGRPYNDEPLGWFSAKNRRAKATPDIGPHTVFGVSITNEETP